MSQDNPPKSIFKARGAETPASGTSSSPEPNVLDQQVTTPEPAASAKSASASTESDPDPDSELAEIARFERELEEKIRKAKEQAAPSKQFQETLDTILEFCLEPVAAALVKQAARGTTLNRP